MPRIRTIKPEFWADEKLSLLDPTTRLVFLGLISMADDAGRLIDNVKLIDGMLFPSTDDTCRDALDVLARLSRVTRYRSSSGQSLIQITKWEDHQKVDKPSRYVLPGPETAVVVQPRVPSLVTEAVASDSRDSREDVARHSRSDLGPRTLDRGPRTDDLGAATVPPRKPRRAPTPAPEWLAPIRDRWIERVGAVPSATVTRCLSGAIAVHGLEKILAAIDAYAEKRIDEAKPLKFEWFAGELTSWIARSAPLVDADGILNERGRALLVGSGS